MRLLQCLVLYNYAMMMIIISKFKQRKLLYYIIFYEILREIIKGRFLAGMGSIRPAARFRFHYGLKIFL